MKHGNLKEVILLKKDKLVILESKFKIKLSNGINLVGFILTMMAGWIDAVAIRLLLNHSPTFMTGRAEKLAYSIFNADFEAFFLIGIVIIAFILGAYLSTLITRKTGLMGGLTFAGVLIIIGSFPVCLNHKIMDSVLLPMAMGGQNAATSLTMINRTTHLTGSATDIGINIAKGNWRMVYFWLMRWIGFPIGSLIGFNLVNLVESNSLTISSIMIMPAVIIIVTGVLQRLIFNIQLLE